ncbi:MAG: hypothetical protein H0W65_08935 [Sphingomonas sp.]|uniref:hypothetical protein n=1 Tax=Sphingomonas sp. TaxID=28214 RepID=UPI0017B43E6D|nr:hypothetical protein [Sphingomonas sp.]MBA3667832.1 hypothetical protein [Sphingomonas sp.]
MGFVLALGAALIPAPALAKSPKAPVARDGSHDMDFSFGTWRTDIKIFKNPIDKPNEFITMTGTKRTTPVWNGKAALEQIEADGAGSHWEALNLMLYDPVARQWSQNYVDSEVGRMEDAPQIGEMRDGKLEFNGLEPINGRATLVRGVWTITGPDTHNYRISRSVDGGRSWHTSFTANLTRIK